MSTLNTYNLKSPDSANTNLALDASGNVAIQAGSASTPSVYVTGDANTGLYSPGADQIAVATGGTARVYIDSSGRVGIGDSAPGTFDVRGAKLTLADSTSDGIGIKGRRDSLDRWYVGYNSSDHLEINQIRNNTLAFKTNNTEVARLTNSGQLLVGTSTARSNIDSPWGNFTPSVQFESTNNGVNGLSIIANATDGYPGEIVLGCSRGSSAGSNTAVQSGQRVGQISFQGADGTNLIEAAEIKCEIDATPGANDMPGRLVFSTTADGASSPTERMRIGNTGYTQLIAVTGVQVNSSVASAGTTHALFDGLHSGTTGSPGTGTRSVVIFTNGNIQNTNGSYTALSDAKLKENIVEASSQWSDIKAIQIRNWNFKAETGHETHRQIGPIAQELETVCPGLVFEIPDRDADGNETGEVTKGVNQSVLYMKAVKALQEAMERIEQLETSNADLLARVTALETA